MRWGLLACGLFLASCGHRIVRSDPELLKKHPDVRSIVQSNQAFGLDLHHALPAEGNLFFSPASIHVALAMTYAGARGQTAAEMAKVLHLSLSDDRLHGAFADLKEALNTVATDWDGEKLFQLAVANALWGQKGYPFRAAFSSLLERTYGAGLTGVDFQNGTATACRKINDWVKERTAGKIPQLLDESSVTVDTRLVLTNAVYFKSRWASPFSPAATVDQPFTPAAGPPFDVRMMRQEERLLYAELWGLQVLALPYAGNELSMIVLLPRKADGLAALEHELDSARLDELLAQLESKLVRVFLPRFTFRSQLELKPMLHALGMRSAFHEDLADFSGMAEPSPDHRRLLLTGAVHEAFVAVDEAGTEAAAATAAIAGLEAALIEEPEKPRIFRADHPFLFLIRHNPSSEILFLGRVADPR